MEHAHLESVRLTEEGRLFIIDQSRLPGELAEQELCTLEDMVDAIYQLRVRGAPAIGICAGYCLFVLTGQLERSGLTGEAFRIALGEKAAALSAARPTAVNLSWAVRRMLARADSLPCAAAGEIVAALRDEAVSIHREDIAMCRAISEYGLSLLRPGDGVLTHCNAGPLATSRYGTGQGPFFLAAERGIPLKIFADETRPLLQGARLTAWELERAGADVTLICDNMASIVMKNGWIQACMVGCDRVAANGDTANKIGTSGVAILAKHYGIPFYVLGPTSTIDLNCPDGAHIPIEQRPPEELRTRWYARPMAPEGVMCYNPSFDVTDHALISAIITEKGICRPPYDQSLAALFSDGDAGTKP